MIIIKLSGGLGNQMFQYAYGRSLALRLNKVIYFDAGLYAQKIKVVDQRIMKLEKFPKISLSLMESSGILFSRLPHFFRRLILKYSILRYLFNINLIKEGREINLERIGKNNKINYFDGTWFSFHHFDDFAGEIANVFTFSEEIKAANSDILNEINKSSAYFVHIRRGDYIKLGWDLKSDYYKKAILALNKRENSIKLFVFSDDISWVKDNMKFLNDYNIRFITCSGNDADLEELLIMSRCKGGIIANSTFSWWAAWLSGSRKIYFPLDWSPDCKYEQICGRCPEYWLGI